MDDWFETLQKDIHDALEQTEQWLEEASVQATEAVDEFLDASDAAVDEIASQVEPLINRALEDLENQIDPLVSPIALWLEQIATPVHQTVSPWLNDHPQCSGCRFYHGESYGSHMLVCAPHPNGPDRERCPDWESNWPREEP